MLLDFWNCTNIQVLFYRHLFQQTSRNCKKLFNEARERASKALGFAKALRKVMCLQLMVPIANQKVMCLQLTVPIANRKVMCLQLTVPIANQWLIDNAFNTNLIKFMERGVFLQLEYKFVGPIINLNNRLFTNSGRDLQWATGSTKINTEYKF